MDLTSRQHKFLKTKAHHLHPVVRVGDSGLSEAVCAATDEALEAHELIKVRFHQGDRRTRREMAEALCERCGAELIQEIGRMAVIYRPAREPEIRLPPG